MINTALKMNPRITFDFITVGTGEGNMKDLVAKIEAPTEAQKPSLLVVPTHEDLNGAVMTILTGRFKGEAPKLVEAPKEQAPKVEAAAATEAQKPVEAPVTQAAKTETAPVQQAPKTDAVKAEAPVVATAAAQDTAAVAASTPSAPKKKWYRFGH
jgi:hypothetical protein